ncbi:MAG TPA: phospholipase D family protein [Sandaracinaceae bacterium LLY-WYZ-13_1]|nr:phospholipase D family protein [Sandaracinaceae bacterium LLY-WYZ-13_1]
MIADRCETRRVAMSLIADRGHYDTVVRAVLEAKVSVWIATANLKGLWVEADGVWPGRRGRARYRSVLEAFDELAARGVELRILHAGFPSRKFRDEYDRHPRLVRGGLELRQCPRLHLKAVIVDGRRLYLGSANWTGAGLGAKGASRRNFELGIWTGDEALLDEVQGWFEHLWRGGECAGCGRRDVCDAPIDELLALPVVG